MQMRPRVNAFGMHNVGKAAVFTKEGEDGDGCLAFHARLVPFIAVCVHSFATSAPLG